MPRSLAPLFALALFACGEGGFEAPRLPDGNPARLTCADLGIPLSLEPSAQTIGAGQFFLLEPRGGTGAYRFRLLNNESGAQLDPVQGLYLAGEVVDEDGSVDVVVLEDDGCRGEASATLTVIAASRVEPSRAELEPSTTIQLVGVGGSGAYRFERGQTWESGGSIDEAGNYTAGGGLGRDVVVMVDTGIPGEPRADAVIDVVRDASLQLETPRWVVPVGSRFPLPVTGGSGTYDVELAGGAPIRVEDGWVVGASPGSVRATVQDRFTSGSVEMAVTVVQAHDAPRRHDTDRSELARAYPAGDIDGDGNNDVVVAMPLKSGARFRSGLVAIYRGTGTGIEPTPARVIQGQYREGRFGQAVALADIDEDGRIDLLIGGPFGDPTQRDIGTVEIYPGVEGELFAADPSRTFLGGASFTRFGHSIVVCDMNGDSHPDMAVGVPFQEDREGRVIANDQGAIQVFVSGQSGGLVSVPDQTLFGVVPDAEGELEGVTSLRLGLTMVGGDFDGDGLCDVAAHGLHTSGDRPDAGLVALYLGRGVDGPDRGGLRPEPSIVWASSAPGDQRARLGQSLAMGDIDGDMRADLVMGQHFHDGPDAVDAGAVYMVRGRLVAEGQVATSLTEVSSVGWMVEGGPFDRVGNDVELADVDGDGLLDVVTGNSRMSLEGSELSRPGVVQVYRGRSNGPESVVFRQYEGPSSGAFFGMALGNAGPVIPPLGDDVLIFAPYYDSADGNDDVGALYLQSGDMDVVQQVVERPIADAGQQLGGSVALLEDLDGDGRPELAVGARLADRVGGRNAGAVSLYRGTDDGAVDTPYARIEATPLASDGDEVGRAVRSLGDFSGDGRPDLAVVARLEDRPDSFDAARYVTEDSCAGGRQFNPGAVWVHRGTDDGVEEAPRYLYFGPFSGQFIDQVSSPLDFDGDGRNDLAVAGREWDGGGTSSGGVAIYRGRGAPEDGRIGVVCTPDWQWSGAASGERLGEAITSLGDLDGDGCDELAAGAPQADPSGRRNAGVVEVTFGYGDACATPTPRRVRLLGADQDSQAGRALAGGLDLDGDRVADLMVGAPNFRNDGGEVGRVVLVSGARILAAVEADVATIPLLDSSGGVRRVVDGDAPGVRLGFSLALGVVPGRGPVVVIGEPFGSATGVSDTGGVLLYEVSARGFDATPFVRMVGEAIDDGELGQQVSARTVGDRLWVAVGAPWSSVAGVEDGASYAFVVD